MINPKYIPIKIKKKGKTYTLYNIFVFKNTIKKQFPEEKVIQIQKRRKDYKIQFKSRKKITIDFEGNVK